MYIVAYNPKWPSQYEQIQSQLLAVYQGEIQFHHIGSTAVPGLYAKDCIDVLGVVDDITAVQANIGGFESLGFEYRGEYGITGRAYFARNFSKVHVHIFQHGHGDIKKHLGFVRLMNSSPELIARLNALKIELVDRYPLDKDSYQKQKAGFYDELHKLM